MDAFAPATDAAPDASSAFVPVSWALAGFAVAVTAGFGAALALGMVRVGRASIAPARLIDGPPLARVAPTLVAVGDLPPVLAALGARRWLVVGAWPADIARTRLAATVAPGSAATEVLAALRLLAAREGAPVAVLVTDASTLDRRDARPPLDELLAVLDGCVPCVCVVGNGYRGGVASPAVVVDAAVDAPSGTA